jgi:hypothetical protein
MRGLPWATESEELPYSNDAIAAVSFCPAITAVTPIMVTIAIMHNTLKAVFILFSF